MPVRWIRYRGVAVALTVASLGWGAFVTAARIDKVDGDIAAAHIAAHPFYQQPPEA